MSGHWWPVVYWSSLSDASQSQFLQRSTHSSLCAGFRGNVVYVFVIKCENTSVGEDFKEVCLYVFLWNQEHAGLLKLFNLTLRSSLHLLTNDLTIFTTWCPCVLHISLIKPFGWICHCVISVCGILWKRNVLLKRKKRERNKPQKQKCGKKKKVHRKIS